MHISFIYPTLLWLLLLVPVLWAFTLAAAVQPYDTGRSHTTIRLQRSNWRFWATLLVRSSVLIALVLALAGAQLVRTANNLTVVFLIDGSDSVSPVQRQHAIAFVNEAITAGQAQDQAAVVVFGQNALVERAPGELTPLGQLTSVPISSRTNIEEAIQLGLTLFPADTQQRLVLLSDGHENNGRAVEAARLAALRGVPIDVVTLPQTSGADVLVSALEAPDVVREGQDVSLQAHLYSTIATTGELQVLADGELVATLPVELEPGATSVPISVAGGTAGFRRYEVRLEAQGDTQPLNNRAAAFTTVQGPPHVLLVATEPERARALHNALDATGARVTTIPPSQLPTSQVELKGYAAVILVDVPARDVPRAAQTALPIYVREQGGSLAMIGGFDAFSAGGWRRSPLVAALPVELDTRDTEERPDVALTLVIDRSGSMAVNDGGGGRTRLDLAKEAVYQSSLGLEQHDQIGVVVFDTQGEWVLPMQPLPDVMAIEQALSQFGPGGGTNIRSGIALAAEALPPIAARTKHVILLTDGIADSNYADLIDQMRNEQITVSVVSIGMDANPALRQIAELGGGRFYRVNTVADVPRVFLAETITIAARDIVEEPFIPVVAWPAPIVRDLGQLPPLYGYNVTEARLAARSILVTPDGHPLLAQWQYGLGRGVAWTSDLKGQWANELIQWAEFPRFAVGLLDVLLPPQQMDGLALETRVEGAQAILEVSAQDGDGRPLDAATLQGRLLDPEDESLALTFTQIGPGLYRAVAEVDQPGAYLAQIAVLGSEAQPVGSISGGLVVTYSPEYNPRADRPVILDILAALTGGRQEPAPATVFASTAQRVDVAQEIALPLLWLALLLWPLDIALRRLFIRYRDLAALLARLPRPLRQRQQRPTPASGTLQQLQIARSRAQARQRRSALAVAPAIDSEVQEPSLPGSPASAQQTPHMHSTDGAHDSGKQRPTINNGQPDIRSQPPASHEDALVRLLVAKQRAHARQRRPRTPAETGEE